MSKMIPKFLKLFLFFGLFSNLVVTQESAEFNLDEIVYDENKIDGRIVGGEKVDIKNRNYQVSLVYEDESLCGGVLIDPFWVLTARHCTVEKYPEEITVRAGSNFYNESGYTNTVDVIYSRRDFGVTSLDNDISLLKLSQPYTLNETVGIISLATILPPVGTTIETSGYGKIGDTPKDPRAPYLSIVETKIVDINVCKAEWSKTGYGVNKISDAMFCSFNKGKEACRGDSGGPVTYNNELIGLVSKVDKCAETISVSVNVPYFKGWIEAIVQTKSIQRDVNPDKNYDAWIRFYFDNMN